MTTIADIELRLLLLREEFRYRILRIKRGKKEGGTYKLPHGIGSRNAEGIAIVAIVKDEAHYLPEWLEFHLLLGVRHIFLYDNGSTDNTPEVLAPYLRDNLVTIVPWQNFSASLNPQSLAYNHALANFGPDFAWMAFIDLDEFLYPAKAATLEEAMQALAHLPAVSLPWICFGPSGHETRPQGLVIKNFVERVAFPPRTDQYTLIKYKAIVNPREIVGANWPHLVHTKADGPILINDRGEKFPSRRAKDLKYVTADHLRLHHYFTRSNEDMQRKLRKGRVDQRGRVQMNLLDRRFKQYLRHTEPDTVMHRFIPELERRLAQRYGRKMELAAQA